MMDQNCSSGGWCSRGWCSGGWRSGGWRFASTSLYLATVLVWLVGCGDSQPKDAPTGETTSDAAQYSAADAEALLAKVRATYAEASSYSDNAVFVFYSVPRATGGERIIPYTHSSLSFERPNRMYLSYQMNVASPQEEVYELANDGLVVRSTADELPDQVHEAIAPVRLSAENFIPEPALRGRVLENSIENSLPQLAMLVRDPDASAFPGEDRLRQLSDDELDGSTYYRLELTSPAGKRVLWIDPEDFTMRRMEIPIDSQRETLNAKNQHSEIAVWIDFENVTLDGSIDPDVFTLDVPDGSRRMRRFIRSPPEGPPKFLGRPTGDFEFVSMDGEVVSPATLRGKVAVLDFWSTNCPPCRRQTPVLNEAYEHFRDNEEVAFYAISTDNRAVANDAVAKTLANWGGGMPVLRDVGASGIRVLNIRQTPTLLTLDREGRLQTFQIGAHTQSQPLIDLIQRLVDGEDLVATDREKHAQLVADYEAALDAAEIRDATIEVEVIVPDIPERRLPEALVARQLWQTEATAVSRPGAVLSAADGSTGALVLDDGRTIVELDENGKVVSRHDLPDHPERRAGFLRRWTSEAGETWTLASGAGWQAVYVYDAQWRPVLTFPDESHSGIGDVLFSDLTGLGTPVIHVGYWGGLGVQGGTFDGRRLWSNRRLDHVLQLCVGSRVAATRAGAPDSQSIFATSTRGTVMQMAADGRSIVERYIPGKAMMYLASRPDADIYCGLSIAGAGEYTAVGFNAANEIVWEYELPPGEYVEQVPRVQSVDLPGGSAAWLVVAANGSLHWLDEAGELIDRFDYGATVTGIAAQLVGEQTLLIVSTVDEVTAWQLGFRDAADASPSDAAESP